MAKKNGKNGLTAWVNKGQGEGTSLIAAEVDNIFGGSGYQIPIGAPLPQLIILRETPQFETPDGEAVKAVVGHIIYWHHANQYYAAAFGEGEPGPPSCCSSDGLQPDGGEEMQDGPCRACKMNEYGSAEEGRGKACQNTIRLYFLPDRDVIPSIVKASPASLGKKEALMKWLTNAPNVASKAGVGTKYQPIKVKLSLHKKDFADSGFSASVLDVETVRVLCPREETDMITLRRLGTLYADFMSSYLGRIQQDVAAEPVAAVQDEPSASPDDDCPF